MKAATVIIGKISILIYVLVLQIISFNKPPQKEMKRYYVRISGWLRSVTHMTIPTIPLTLSEVRYNLLIEVQGRQCMLKCILSLASRECL
jgi:hypothetical protein